MAYPLIILASFVVGITRPRVYLLLLGPFACGVLAVATEATVLDGADNAGLGYFFGFSAEVISLLAGLVGYGIAKLLHRRRIAQRRP